MTRYVWVFQVGAEGRPDGIYPYIARFDNWQQLFDRLTILDRFTTEPDAHSTRSAAFDHCVELVGGKWKWRKTIKVYSSKQGEEMLAATGSVDIPAKEIR